MIDGKHKAWHHSGSISSPLPSWDSSPQEHLRIACVAKFHHCSRTLVCHRSSTLKVKMDGQKTCPMSQPLLPTIHEAAGQLWAALRSVYCATQGVLSPTPPAASLL